LGARYDTDIERKGRIVYYLSMEYLPGRILGNNITNLRASDLVCAVLKKTNRKIEDIMCHEADPGLGNGGLGRLASCFLDSLATQNYTARGYGLRYQYGIFEQSIQQGLQIERPDCWLISENPWEFRRDSHAVKVKFGGDIIKRNNIHAEPTYDLNNSVSVWAIPYDIPIVGYALNPNYSVLTLRLWTTRESPHNFQLQSYNSGRLDEAAENTDITHVLYPNDSNEMGKRMRLKQEYLLVAATLQDVMSRYVEMHGHDFSNFADKVTFQINDTHPSILVAELMRSLTHGQNLSWGEAWDITQNSVNFTNHTVLKEALEEWPRELFQHLLPRQHEIIERINMQLCNEVRKKFKGTEEQVRNMSILENGNVRMANLAIYGSRRVNGVAAIHSNILKQSFFKDFYRCYPDKFVNVTNGITQRRWLLHCNPELANFISARIGKGWVTDFSQIKKIADFARDEQSQEEFWRIKQNNKRRLYKHLERKNSNNVDWTIDFDRERSYDTLCDVHIKRIHEYKRQLLNILQILMMYYDVIDPAEPRRIKRNIIFAGKAAPGYVAAKHIILLTHCVSRLINNDPIANKVLKVIFVENYNVSQVQMIIPAADISEQISTAGTEASGTGNMKLAVNGALTIGTDDGANIEMREEIGDRWWPFKFGCSAKEIEKMRARHSYNPWDICNKNAKIKRVLDTLSSGALSKNTEEQQALNSLHHSLLEAHYEQPADRYFILKDLEDYYNTQKNVERLYQDNAKWTEYCLHNIAGMGKFSADNAIANYTKQIWNLEPTETDYGILGKIRQEYEAHNKYEILRNSLEKVQGFIKT
jgi:glycogen phosphorylase